MKLKRSLIAAFALLLCGSMALTGCSNDEPAADSPIVKEGVIFNFKRKVVYAATGVNEIGSVKITVTDGSRKIELPSSPLEGDENLVQTRAFALGAGDYELISYKAYDKRHNWLFDMELDSLNEFRVESAKVSSFIVPVKSRNMLNNSFIRSALMGICLEVFGEDDSTWPWDPEKYPYPDWEGLEFEFDDYGNPMYITGICFMGYKDGKETPWVQMTALPDGTVSNLATIENLTFTDLPNFKKLPDDLNILPSFGVLTCVNTGLEELPANLHMLTKLMTLTINESQLKEIPAGMSKLTDLRVLHLRDNQIARAEVSLKELKKLESLDLSQNPLESIGEDILPADGKLIELHLSNTKLSALPGAIARMPLLRGIYLNNCQFTSVPAQVKGNPGIKGLHLGGNPISSISTSDFANLTELETLWLSDIQLGTLPRIASPTLLMLEVTNCGLTTAPDLSGLPELRSFYAGANKFTTLPANYFAANTKMRILSLANSPSLTSMPAGNLGLKSKIAENVEGFKWLIAENCPSLTWTTPAEWQCYDQTRFEYGTKSTRRPDIAPGDIYDEYHYRVMVNRKGSPNITFGK